MRKNLFVATTAAIALMAGFASAQEVRLRAAMFVPPTTAFGEPFKKFVDHVNETGKGKVQIQLLDQGAVPPFEQGNAVGSGVLDIATIPPAYYKNKMVEGEATIFSNMSFLEHRSNGAWAAMNKLHNEKVNVQYLAGYADGVKFHIWLTKPVANAAALKGLKLRSTPNFAAFFNSLGVTSVTTPPGEVYTALERGVVDGYGWPRWGIHDLSWDKYTKVRVDPGFYNVVVNVLMNLPKYRSLTPDQRKVLDDASIWLETNFPKWRDEKTVVEEAKQKASGVQVLDFGPSFEKQANDAYMADLIKASPDNMAMLMKLLVK